VAVFTEVVAVFTAAALAAGGSTAAAASVVAELAASVVARLAAIAVVAVAIITVAAADIITAVMADIIMGDVTAAGSLLGQLLAQLWERQQLALQPITTNTPTAPITGRFIKTEL